MSACVFARADRREVRRTDGGEEGGRKIERTRTIVIAFFDTYFLSVPRRVTPVAILGIHLITLREDWTPMMTWGRDGHGA
eukprot:COSAG01_NODE_1572_length_9867_cov_16.671171_1_plen_80_part_00